jgi:hypothetical protein
MFPVALLGGRAVAQAVSRWLPTAAARVRVRAGMWGLWWTKRHWGRFSRSTSVSPANHSSNFSIIITRGWHNRPIGGRSAEWTQLDSTPHYTNLKKIALLVCRIFADDHIRVEYSAFQTEKRQADKQEESRLAELKKSDDRVYRYERLSFGHDD